MRKFVYIGFLLLIFTVTIFFVKGTQLCKTAPEGNSSANLCSVHEELENGEALLNCLKNEISGKTDLDDLIAAFDKVSRLPIDGIPFSDNLLLFETGTFSFSGDPFFYFSFTRQFPNGEGEYYQLHLDIKYTPSKTNEPFQRAVWFELEEDFIQYVKKSEEYLSLKDQPIVEISAYLGET